MHSPYSDRITTQLHDQLAVAIHTDDVAFQTFEQTCYHTELDMIFCKFHKWVTEESHIFRMAGNKLHKGLHHLVGYTGRFARTAIINQMVLRIICPQEGLQFDGSTLKENKSAHCRQQLFDNTLSALLLLYIYE